MPNGRRPSQSAFFTRAESLETVQHLDVLIRAHVMSRQRKTSKVRAVGNDPLPDGSASTHDRSSDVLVESSNNSDIIGLRRRLDKAFEQSRHSRGNIDDNNAAELSSKTIAERLEILDQRAVMLDGQPPSAFIRKLFPELLANEPSQPSLPKKAPTLWDDRIPGETPPQFLMRTYEPWLGKGLIKADIRRLDWKLYNSFQTWVSKNGWPEGLVLPTLKERNDSFVAALREKQASGSLNPDDLPTDDASVRRMISLLGRRRIGGASPGDN